MILRLLLLGLMALTLQFSATASELDEIDADVDQLNADSDAAAADSDEIKSRMAKDKARAERALKAAAAKNKAAAAKRQQAADQLKKADEEIQNMSNEQARLNADAERLDREAAASQKAMAANQAKVAQIKKELEAIRAIRAEKAKAFIEITSQQDKIKADLEQMEQEKTVAEAELEKVKEQEKVTIESLAKLKTEEAAKKAKLEAYIAGLRERFHQAQERIAAMEGEKTQLQTANQKLESTAKVAENEVIQAEAQLMGRRPSEAKASGSKEYTFKKKCNVFDRPAKGANIVAVKSSGTTVQKSDEGKSWIAFPLTDGRKGFVAKTCLNSPRD